MNNTNNIERAQVLNRQLQQWGGSAEIHSQPGAAGIFLGANTAWSLIKLAFDVPKVITIVVCYSMAYDPVINDTRCQIKFGTGRSGKTIEVEQGVYTFMAQNFEVGFQRYDVAAVANLSNFVDVYAVETPGSSVGWTPISLIP